MFMPHPVMSSEEMRARTQGVWDKFDSLPAIWKRSACTPTGRDKNERQPRTAVSPNVREHWLALQPIAHDVHGLLCGPDAWRK